ncbi:hypothetical protein [Dendrosporobacter sp. 1207_IL3150]|uniref:hypothetical protein n=1 Tax=Dendrosporobacter sp. 1207_IL3150 TaxID=3084054 RepID=UPI002FD8956B
MQKKIIIGLLFAVLALSGCYRQDIQPKAGLNPVNVSESELLNLSGNISENGMGNNYRFVSREGSEQQFIELAAGGSGRLEYFREIDADLTAIADLRIQFLSTQGIGRIKLEALDIQGKAINTIGWAVTGEIPANSSTAKWIDARYGVNYKGNWINASYDFTETLVKHFTAFKAKNAAKYRVSVEVGMGQHVLVDKLGVYPDINRALSIVPLVKQHNTQFGEQINVDVEVVNNSNRQINNAVIKIIEPYGYGLIAQSQVEQLIDNIKPGEKRKLSWQVKAQRPDAVNLNKPWKLTFAINGTAMSEAIDVYVADNRPGRIFYVMTDDLEPIDAAGYPVAWGNSNGWLEPKEFSIQLIEKAEKLNSIAERHGAKWTHYIAWPALKAGEWAAKRSATGEWPKVIEAVKNSVIQQTNQGHEYGIHMHSDYDPYLTENVLSYNPEMDGIWANHLRHGWAHSLPEEGNFDEYGTRTGTLYNYQSILEQLASRSGQGQLLTSRVGSFDFGNGSEDEAKSTRVYQKVGIWGTSDADGNAGGITSGDYGKEIYFSAKDDINSPSNDINNIGLVEFRPTPKSFITYDSQSADVMNAKADEGIKAFTRGMSIIPGVHAIVGFTHAMFVMGAGDWQSIDGGQFNAIEGHLEYLKQNYADKSLLEFSTATELVANYLDYYSPRLIAVYGKRIKNNAFSSEYEINILGRDIPIDKLHTHAVSIKYPLYLRSSAYKVSILKNDQLIYTTWGLPTPYNDIEFSVDDRSAKYTLKVYQSETIHMIVNQIRSIKQKIIG